MRHIWFSYIATSICLFLLAGLIMWYISPNILAKSKVVSPLPSFLNLWENSQVSSIDLWFPKENIMQSLALEKPQISAEAAIVYDLTSDTALYTKNEHRKLPMASLTKIMTAIIALENKKEDDRYIVSKENLVGEDSMGLGENEILTQEELLYGLMLPSGNDAAEVLASNYPLGREAFILAMNNKAKSFGLLDTHFTNSSGLQGDGKQYTTVYDLLIITKYAFEHFPLFQKIVETSEYQIPYSQTHKAFYLENETNLLTTYPGVKGVKTGYTPEAGLCLATYLDYNNHQIIGVLLNSNNRREDMKELLDYSLKVLGITPPSHG
ncbi:MAG: D-alanyl-D-alanine carboxypeptidase [Candidatus Levyibacteriota bacterium]|nr:MAG: D-alanyl-D-alanine carboxypeptidase [Candidatus Levybacteria bacterium]